MATQNIQAASVHPDYAKGIMWDGLEAATQTFLVGAVLILASGFVQEGGADPTAIYGIALSPGANKGSNGLATTLFTPILPGMLLEMNLCGGAASDFTLTQADLGAVYGIVKRSSGTTHWVVDQSDTTNVRVRIVGFAAQGGRKNGDLVGDVNARVLCTLLPMQSTNYVSAWGG